jgi:hypothetical protein
MFTREVLESLNITPPISDLKSRSVCSLHFIVAAAFTSVGFITTGAPNHEGNKIIWKDG